jgi:hypothetical protein
VSTPQALAVRALALLVVALVAGGAGYLWGREAAHSGQAAKAARVATQQLRGYQDEVRLANQAEATFLDQHRTMEARYAALDRAHRDLLGRMPLAVPARVDRRVAGDPVGSGLVRKVEAPVARVGTAPGVGPADVAAADDADPELTLAAVRVWNAALTGTDAPSGACGPAADAAGADAACARSSGLRLSDAWNNQRANAQACAFDRQQLRHLIEFLTQDRD